MSYDRNSYRVMLLLCGLVLLPYITLAYTPPNLFPARARGGSLYLRSQEKHLTLARGTFQNGTANIFQQLIDHSDPKRGTFGQRFWYDTSYFSGDVAFLYIGGEGPEYGSPMGYATTVGKNFSALLVTLEHRYYGLSTPSNLTDKTTLRTLSIGTVMADVGAFLDYFEASIVGRPLRWVAVGGSYAGALSAWLKVTYPSRFVASWSSSGVVHPQFDFTNFDGHLLSVLPPNCLQAMRNIMSNFSARWDNPNQRSGLRNLFGTPEYFSKSDMAWMLADGGAMAVQYGSKLDLCTAVYPPQEDILAQYAAYILALWGPSFGSNCYYSTACLSDPSMQDQWVGADYGWVFQCCYELAYWQVAYPNSLRAQSITSEYFIDQCRSAFWPDIFPDTFLFNAEYGGATPNATNVIALQGSDDPWITAGVQSTLVPNSYVEYTAVCDGCGHCGDLGYADSEAVAQQQEYILGQLRRWVATK